MLSLKFCSKWLYCAFVLILISCGDDESSITTSCKTPIECLTNDDSKIWILSSLENVPRNQWTDCMLDTELIFRANGSWQKDCPGIQDVGNWYFNMDQTTITAVPGIGSGFHGDSAVYQINTLDDETLTFSCIYCLPGYVGGRETLKAK